MLKNSRVGRSVDTSRLGAALAGPGMDTRIWASLAVVTGVTVDDQEGVFANVVLMPSQTRGTARVGCEYAGSGFGLHAPLEVDDEVLVEAPSGDPNEGLVVTRRLHSPSDPPPQQAIDHPSDVVLVVKDGQSLRLLIGGTGKVVLADDGAAQPSMRGDAFVTALDHLLTLLSPAIALISNIPGLTVPQVGMVTAATEGITAFQQLESTFTTDKAVVP